MRLDPVHVVGRSTARRPVQDAPRTFSLSPRRNWSTFPPRSTNHDQLGPAHAFSHPTAAAVSRRGPSAVAARLDGEGLAHGAPAVVCGFRAGPGKSLIFSCIPPTTTKPSPG